MPWQQDLQTAHTQMTAVLRALESARSELAQTTEACSNGGIAPALKDDVASGWRKWTQDVNSFVQGKVAEVGSSTEMSTTILATSVHSDADRTTVFAESTGLPPLRQEYKVVSAPTRTQASAVQGMMQDAVNQLGVAGRADAGDMQQAVVEVLTSENTWPCSYAREVDNIEGAANRAAKDVFFGGERTAYNFAKLKMLEQHAQGKRPAGLPPGGSVIVKSMFWGVFFRINGTKVICSTTLD